MIWRCLVVVSHGVGVEVLDCVLEGAGLGNVVVRLLFDLVGNVVRGLLGFLREVQAGVVLVALGNVFRSVGSVRCWCLRRPL